MSKLPNLASMRPTYSLTLPTTKKIVKYSPFTNKDDKNIMIAAQEKNMSAVYSTLIKIMEECCGGIEIDNVVDFIYITAHIKAKSHGESHDFIYRKCDCGHENIEIKVPNILEKIKVKNPDKQKSTFVVNDQVSLRLKPTGIDFLSELSENNENDIDETLKMLYSIITHSIEYVVYGKEIIKDFTIEDLRENIVSNLSSKQIDDIQRQINDMISVVFEVEAICPECKTNIKTEITSFLF